MEFENSFESRDTAVCPLCGGEAEWGILEDNLASVEVICINCGRFEAPRARLEEAQTERLNPDRNY
jgi:uncharacterized Zn finger protein